MDAPARAEGDGWFVGHTLLYLKGPSDLGSWGLEERKGHFKKGKEEPNKPESLTSVSEKVIDEVNAPRSYFKTFEEEGDWE